MKPQEVISATKKALEDAEAQGLRSIDPQALRAFLDGLEKRASTSADGSSELEQARLEQYKAELSSWVAGQQHANDWNLEGFRQVIALGQSALRSIVLINGGAAVAVLAFIGHLVSAEAPILNAAQFAPSLRYFVFGVLSGAVAFGTTYLSQLSYDGTEPWHDRLGLAIHVATLAICISAYVLFFLGANSAYEAFAGAV